MSIEIQNMPNAQINPKLFTIPFDNGGNQI